MKRLVSSTLLLSVFLAVWILQAIGQDARNQNTPLGEGLSVEQAIDLIWQGDFDRAEKILQAHLYGSKDPAVRSELLVYLAFVANIRKDDDAARRLLRDALEITPGLVLSPIQFPTALRSLLIEILDDLSNKLPSPRRGELQPPQYALAPEATPPGAPVPKKWYRRWYVWAGIGAAVAVTIIAVTPKKAKPTPTLSPTPTVIPTATPTPTQYIYTGEVLKVGPADLDCAGANGPNRGRTTHSFQVIEPGTPIAIDAVFIEVTVRGDYGPLSIEDNIDKRALILIESNGRYTVEPPGNVNYCIELTKNLDGRTEPGLLGENGQIKTALAGDGRLDIVISPRKDVVENCGKGGFPCTPFHKVNVEVRYRYVE